MEKLAAAAAASSSSGAGASSSSSGEVSLRTVTDSAARIAKRVNKSIATNEECKDTTNHDVIPCYAPFVKPPPGMENSIVFMVLSSSNPKADKNIYVKIGMSPTPEGQLRFNEEILRAGFSFALNKARGSKLYEVIITGMESVIRQLLMIGDLIRLPLHTDAGSSGGVIGYQSRGILQVAIGDKKYFEVLQFVKFKELCSITEILESEERISSL